MVWQGLVFILLMIGVPIAVAAVVGGDPQVRRDKKAAKLRAAAARSGGRRPEGPDE